VQLDADGRPVCWGEAGEVGLEKLRLLGARYRETHLVFAKWAINLQPFTAMLDTALAGVRRSAPTELIGFDANAARCVDPTGQITIGFEDVTCRRWES